MSGARGTPIYLDFAASTPVDTDVARAMSGYLTADGVFANPSSIHAAGRRAHAAVERARQQLAELLSCDASDLIWTSGATESVNLAVTGAARYRSKRGKHLITMPTEHKAVADTFAALTLQGFDVTYVQPDTDGLLPLDRFEAAIREDTQLASIMHVNNETGVIQDIAAIGEICRREDVLFHSDASQSVGKLPIDLSILPVDLMSLTAHKFYGPKGAGALYVADRPGCRVQPLMHGGGQERGLRPGTLAVHQVVGLGAAAALARVRQTEDLVHFAALKNRLWAGIAGVSGILRNGSETQSFPGILNVSVDGVDGESLLLALEPLCVGTGSACNSLNREPSMVLRAMGRDDLLAQSAIRFSFGRDTTRDDIDQAARSYVRAVSHLRRMSPERRLTA